MQKNRFRAWDLRNQIMRYEGDSCGYFDMEQNEVTVINFILKSSRYHKMKFLQCTGLKDNTNKWIYEGDIIETRLGARSIIEYKKGGFWLSDINVPLYQLSKQLKVIGNKYEHKDLLHLL